MSLRRVDDEERATARDPFALVEYAIVPTLFEPLPLSKPTVPNTPMRIQPWLTSRTVRTGNTVTV